MVLTDIIWMWFLCLLKLLATIGQRDYNDPLYYIVNQKL